MNPSSGQALVTGRAHWNGYILCLNAPDVDSRVDFLQTDIRAAAVCATLKVRHQARFETLGDISPHSVWTLCSRR
jgi:hypothetical protein